MQIYYKKVPFCVPGASGDFEKDLFFIPINRQIHPNHVDLGMHHDNVKQYIAIIREIFYRDGNASFACLAVN